MERIRGVPQELKELASTILEDLQEASTVIIEKDTDPDLWCWANGTPTNGTFRLNNRQTYRTLLSESEEWKTLNARWRRQDPEPIWEARWKKIWGSDLTRRTKLFLWRIVMNSMYNMVRAQKLGHGDGYCPLCPGHEETNEHIFFLCFKAQRGWGATVLFYEPHPRDSSLIEAQSIRDIIDGCLEKSPVATARLFVVHHTCWELWNQRNDRTYNHKHPIFSARKTAELAKEHIAAAARYNMSYKKRRRLRKATEYILPCRPLNALQEETSSPGQASGT